MSDGNDGRHAGDHGELCVRHRDRRVLALVRSPRRGRTQLGADAEPDGRVARSGALPEHARHPRQDVLHGVRPRHAFRELRQDLVRRGALPVDDPVREPRGTVADRVERDRDGRGGEHREERVVG